MLMVSTVITYCHHQEAGKALTELKGSREELKKRVEELALYYCESPDSFDITQFYTSLHCFTQQVSREEEVMN